MRFILRTSYSDVGDSQRCSGSRAPLSAGLIVLSALLAAPASADSSPTPPVSAIQTVAFPTAAGNWYYGKKVTFDPEGPTALWTVCKRDLMIIPAKTPAQMSCV